MGLDLFGSSGAVTEPFHNLPPEVQAWVRDEGGLLSDITRKARNTLKGDLKKGYQQYGGDRVAGFNPVEQEGLDALRGLPGELRPIEDKLGELGGLDYTLAGNPQMIEALYNPYQQDVIDATMNDMGVVRQREQMQRAGAAAKAGAFGGSRHGVADAVAMGERDRADAAILSGLRKEGWDTAAGLASGDLDRKSGFNQNYMSTLEGLYGDKGTLGLNRADALTGVGETQRGLEQDQLDVDYQNWDDKQNYVWNLLAKARQGTSNPASNTGAVGSTTTGSTPGLLNTLVGAAGAGTGVYLAGNRQGAW